jgi:hypothetical protein
VPGGAALAQAEQAAQAVRDLLGWVLGLIMVVIILWMLAVAVSTPQTACAATESELLGLIRNARGDRIATSPLLTKIAERRAWDITTNYSHDGADRRFAEILVWNAYPEDVTEAAAVHQWLESAGHRAILLGRYSHVGVGVADVEHKHYYAAVFGNLSTGTSESNQQAPPRLLPATDC